MTADAWFQMGHEILSLSCFISCYVTGSNFLTLMWTALHNRYCMSNPYVSPPDAKGYYILDETQVTKRWYLKSWQWGRTVTTNLGDRFGCLAAKCATMFPSLLLTLSTCILIKVLLPKIAAYICFNKKFTVVWMRVSSKVNTLLPTKSTKKYKKDASIAV